MNTQFNLNAEIDFKTKLESVMDSKGLNFILNSIIDICYEKGSHVAENWQDKALSNDWTATAVKIEKVMPKLEVTCPLW